MGGGEMTFLSGGNKNNFIRNAFKKDVIFKNRRNITSRKVHRQKKNQYIVNARFA